MVTQQQDNDTIIAQELANIKTSSRSGDGVIHRGSEEQPAPMVMNINDEGLVVIYEKKTGRAVPVLKYMLADLLKKSKEADGSLRFTTVRPDKIIIGGTLKCKLHPSDENRQHYDELGLPVCKKNNISSPYMVEQHMKKRHPSAWAIIEQEKKDAKEKEERDFQRALIMSVKGQSQEAKPEVYISDKKKNVTK
jgi:hypothetical protein